LASLLVRDCLLLRTHPERVETLPHQDLLVQDNRIAALGPTGSLACPPDAQRLEARGQLCMPGLVNTHAHVPMVLFRGLAEDVDLDTWFNQYMWPLESNLEREDVYWGMLLGLAEMIEAGVTCVADHYFHMDLAARAVEQAGTRAALGWAVFGSQGPAGVERTASFAAEHRGAASGRITTWLAPHAPYTCDDSFLEGVARAGQRLGLGVHIHAAETRAQTEASLKARGLTPIQVLERTGLLDGPALVAHACGATPEDIGILARHGTGVAHAPKTYLKLAMGAAPLGALRRAGVPVGLASDGAVSNNTLDLWESLRLMTLVQKHAAGSAQEMSLAEALWIATAESARVVGLAAELRGLVPGALADLILVDLGGLHHQPLHSIPASLVYAARPGDVRSVVVDGRVLMRERQLLTLDREEIVAQVGRSMERLARRVPSSRIQVYSP
jgi:5-methylthioadenosine/S-adenosylhomocysteine deaminase